MSLPIGSTPVLRGKQAVEFLKKIYAEENIPAYPVPTPKLKEAERLAREYCKKHTRPPIIDYQI
jgi:hypothetical protein